MIISNPKKLDFICAIYVKGIMNHLIIFKKAVRSQTFGNIHVLLFKLFKLFTGLPRWHSSKQSGSGKQSACQCKRNTEDASLIPVLGRSPGVGNGNPLQYSCLENSRDRRTWQARAHGVTESLTATEHAHMNISCMPVSLGEVLMGWDWGASGCVSSTQHVA